MRKQSFQGHAAQKLNIEHFNLRPLKCAAGVCRNWAPLLKTEFGLGWTLEDAGGHSGKMCVLGLSTPRGCSFRPAEQ